MKKPCFSIFFVLLAGAGGALAQTTIHDITYANGQTINVADPTSITTLNSVIVSLGADVTFLTPNIIKLEPGFHAYNYFHALANTAPVGAVESTSKQYQVVTVQGWALDKDDGAPVFLVNLWLDGLPLGPASLGTLRTDIATYAVSTLGYPSPASRYNNSGWSFAIDVRPLPPGTHSLIATITDSKYATVSTTPIGFTLSAAEIELDTNGNGIPDAVEKAAGYDPGAPSALPPGSMQTYNYDNLDRLTAGPGRTYQYDAEGNVLGQ